LAEKKKKAVGVKKKVLAEKKKKAVGVKKKGKEKIKIYIISGPGGAGKTTLVNKLFEKDIIKDNFIKGITVTTRKERSLEKNGKDYFFIKEEEFLRLKEKDFFLESEKILTNYYGTPKLFYLLADKKKKDLVLCIDVKGGLNLIKNFKAAKIISIFVSAPSKAELKRRMEKRDDNKVTLKKRVELSKKELQFSKDYDYLVTNKDIDIAIKEIERILVKKNSVV